MWKHNSMAGCKYFNKLSLKITTTTILLSVCCSAAADVYATTAEPDVAINLKNTYFHETGEKQRHLNVKLLPAALRSLA